VRNTKSKISIVIGSVLATSLGASPAVFASEAGSAADNPFAIQPLNKGYMVAYADRADPGKYGAGAKSAEGKCGMSLADTNKDGQVSKEEFIKHHEAIFDKIDANKDGSVNQAEADGFAAANKPSAAPHGQMKK
jgi:uncharacterized low-complexity protein